MRLKFKSEIDAFKEATDFNQKEHFATIETYIKHNYQDWLDINAIRHFKSKVNAGSSLRADWVNLAQMSYLMKFYSIKAVG